MEKKGLIIGIDYTDKYCQASYYSRRHECPESIAYGSESMRYLIPSVLCYSHEIKDWLIGQPAIEYGEKTGESVYKNFLENVFLGDSCQINDQTYSYTQLLAVFFGKLIELTQMATSVMGIENITINLRRITQEIRQTIYDAFRILRLPAEKVKLQTCAESFAYYVLNEDVSIWRKGTVLFDFSSDGFYEKVLTATRGARENLIYISERSHSADFSVSDMGNEVLMNQMDERMKDLYDEICSETVLSSVFFTGEGFNQLWFGRTLRRVSETNRAFKGNNLYVKGACLSGLLRSDEENADYNIVCAGRTKCTISVEARHKQEAIILNLSRAPKDWFDAGMSMDFIMETTEKIRFFITSLISAKRSYVDVDVSQFPMRPNKATRVEIKLEFFSEMECVLTVTDKGFGDLFPSSGLSSSVSLNLAEYI